MSTTQGVNDGSGLRCGGWNVVEVDEEEWRSDDEENNTTMEVENRTSEQQEIVDMTGPDDSSEDDDDEVEVVVRGSPLKSVPLNRRTRGGGGGGGGGGKVGVQRPITAFFGRGGGEGGQDKKQNSKSPVNADYDDKASTISGTWYSPSRPPPLGSRGNAATSPPQKPGPFEKMTPPPSDKVLDIKMEVEEARVDSTDGNSNDDDDDDDDDEDFLPSDEEEDGDEMEVEVDETRQTYSDPPVLLSIGLLRKAFAVLSWVKDFVCTFPHHAPDEGALLLEAGYRLQDLGLTCSSFFRPLPPKPHGRHMSVIKVVAKCALYEEDLDGSTIAGRSLRFFTQAMEEQLGLPPGRVVRRNGRDWGCWRKEDGSGCQDAAVLEPAFQQVIDAIYNVCLAYGGWHIMTVIATSRDAVNIQTDAASDSLFHSTSCPDGLTPLADLCYPPHTRVFTSQHLKMLSGDTRGVEGASRSALALACGFSYYLTQIGRPFSIEDVYSAVQQHRYFEKRVAAWEAWEGDELDEAAVEKMKSIAASINAIQCTVGDCLCIYPPKTGRCCCDDDRDHDCSSGRGGATDATEETKRKNGYKEGDSKWSRAGSADYDYTGTGKTTAGGATSTRAGKSNGGQAVPEDSERQGRGVGTRPGFVLVQCEASCQCSKGQQCTCGGKCIWQYQGIKIQNSRRCQDSCVKKGDISPGEECPTHVRQVQRKQRLGSCNHAKVGIKDPDLFNGTVLDTSDTPWPNVPLFTGSRWVVPRMQGGVVVIP